ncbi:MAG: homoserine dehydrogenase [Euryarchaeota archaeon]|nr:homoserine dehydrogenase [Euryarchaeota archaeon]
MAYRIALIGCGVVAQGFMKILAEKGKALKERHGLEAKIVAVSDKLKGSILVPEGIDLPKFLAHVEAGKKVDDFPAKGAVKGLDPVETIKRAPADIVIEVTFTDIKTGEPATTYIKEALGSGKHVITTNKGPIALHGAELQALAKKKKVLLRHEGVVMSGTPVFDLLEFCLAGNDVREVKGILNGTTNFILTKMETDAMPYKDALALAQKLGYAEADPTADVEGFDALAKIYALSKIVLGADIKIEDVAREGISKITSEDIRKAAAEGKRYKLVASARRDGPKVVASVRPEKLPLSDPLAGVSGAINALTFHTDLSGPITIQGAGAGKMETGFALLIDLLAIHREISRRAAPVPCDDIPSDVRAGALRHPQTGLVESQSMPRSLGGKG